MAPLHPRTLSFETPAGSAVAHVHAVSGARGAVVLGHGAGGGVEAPDLVATTAAAQGAGCTVVLVEQPYRVAGRRAPPRAPTLDSAWTAVIDSLRADELGGLPLVVGGRSSGARVACRTARSAAAVAVLCLAFPLQPPRRAGKPPAPSRLAELDGLHLPVLVVQGARDPFGIPSAARDRTVALVQGDHALRTDLVAVHVLVRDWLTHLFDDGPAGLVAG